MYDMFSPEQPDQEQQLVLSEILLEQSYKKYWQVSPLSRARDASSGRREDGQIEDNYLTVA